MDDTQTKADFRAHYQAMNGMTFPEMVTILYPVCALCATISILVSLRV